MSSSDPRRLRGRHGECAALDQLLADTKTGQSQVLVLRGEAGIGKSALVEYLVAGAAGCRIARAAGVESEMELAFAGLHQLCAPLMGYLSRLPDPQRDALTIAFGLSTGSPPDRFLVGLAVLSLLAEAADEQPLVCVVDDAQWLDRVSAQTLAFVARRLFAERVALVFAVRTQTVDDQLAGLRELEIQGLRDDDARALLGSVVLGRVDEHVRDRIVAEARGNPLALLELPQGWTAAELAGGFGHPDTRPLASRIEQSFLRRIASLPVATQRLLLVAAAEPVGDLWLLRRVAERLDIGADAASEAEAAGLIEFGARVRFRHPLVRSAAYRAADAGERRDVHRALAAATDPESDPDRRAWHRAHAAVEPDEAVADELARSADRAQARGGIAAAAAFLRRATGLTPDPVRRGARAMAAAQATFEAGAPDAALELLAAAEMGPLDELQRGRMARLRGQIVFARRRGGEALPMLLDAANRLEHLDDGQAREAYLEAIGSAVFGGRLNGNGGVREVAEAARAAPQGPRPPRLADALLDGLAARFAEGYVGGASLLKCALRDAGDNEDDSMRWLWLTWLAAGDMWDDEAWHELATRAVRTARETGALNFLPLALVYRAAVHVHAGEFDLALTLIEESEAITEAIGNSHLGYGTLLLIAWRGGDDQEPGSVAGRLRDILPVTATGTSGKVGASGLMQSGARWASSWGEGRAIGLGNYLNALLYNGRSQYQAALVCAEKACEHDDLGVFGFALAELVEAGTRSDAPEAAAAALGQLEERATASGTDWALGVLARSRALLSDGQAADLLYREAIERLSRCRIAVDLARTHLVYGEWLRRENRRVDAREQLRTAYEMLHRFGANAFAERARRELLAIGEPVRQRAAETRDGLTAQETQIARLAGDGMTNSEIGAELFISPRTVEWHLRKVFTKLDVNSRRELRGALASH
ncbi:DNA-binding CsgD family transcriptional regulator [Kibdelosporangium banguiense]|uniref:DNA-binding CsgD family transcriptional regulator n=1 Tax=Kibdelosporangium banguiense TaxID=1365924 RepID=A0ABS4TQC4_9PSEU|nr:LuxR family transcriptional regulator [Kibdelosporangium banguiense]MBP2326607.1 DNA-binding CsgD family transcriptional regulator [Kibdelosporangium banguiense]